MAKTEEPVQLELQVGSRDEASLNEIQSALQSVDVKRWPTARMDPSMIVTVLAIAAGSVKLLNALLELKHTLSAQKDAPEVKVRNADGEALNLLTATEELIKEFVKASA